MNNRNYYITTPLYYVNAKPHLGTLYSTVLADVTARWARFSGKKTFFLTGTDEHGQKVQQRALQAGIKPDVFVGSMIPHFKRVWDQYGISYDTFVRTTDQNHKNAVNQVLTRLLKQGDIYKADYSGWYCTPCETFVTIQEDEVPSCSSCSRPLERITEQSYFFRLSSYQDRLLAFYQKHPDFIVPKKRFNEIITFVKSGLKDLSISRQNVAWGIPFPSDQDRTIYVWVDALISYLSGIGFGHNTTAQEEQYIRWWPAAVQVMAKDIIRFHGVYWPALLMAIGLQPPQKLFVHGFVLAGKTKMSKSLGNVIDPEELASLYGPEQIRYYLVRTMAVNHDGNFDSNDLEQCITSDLANSLGNLLNRTTSIAIKNGMHAVKPLEKWHDDSLYLHKKCQQTITVFSDKMNQFKYHSALSTVAIFVDQVNAYFHAQKPWLLARATSELFAEVISATCHSLYAVGLMLHPVMPTKMRELIKSIGPQVASSVTHDLLAPNYVWAISFFLTQRTEPLFLRPDQNKKNLQESKKQQDNVKSSGVLESCTITIDDFAKISLTVGTITQCEPVKGSSKLLKMTVDMGSKGMRTVLAGVGKKFSAQELIGKKGLYVSNLKPRTLMGIVSQGMMLFAQDKNGTSVLVTVPREVENGTQLR